VIRGDVSTMRGDSGDWVATTVNTPVVPGDKIAAGQNSSAEIQLDYANTLRLDQGTEAQVAELTRTRIQIQVAQGTVNFTVFKGTEAQVEISTPNMSVRPLGEGSYRIQVNSPTETQVIVRKGQAEVTTSQGSTTVDKNNMITVQGADNPEYQIAEAPRQDGWDEWNKNRDKEILGASSWRYTNQYYTGSQDLDRYGRWERVPDYDWCWTPNVNAGWVPYYDGRWTWEPFWGWTWVSSEPWGWAPYHYGRWFSRGGSWSWWPGQRGYGYYPTWAPAYVSFLGFGYGGHNWGFGAGFGFSSLGWCPLGPYDNYRPWWGRHNGYNAVNINNYRDFGDRGWGGRNRSGRPYVSNLQQAMNDPHVRRGITTVSSEDFVRGRMSRQGRGIDSATLRQGHVLSGTLPVVPTRDSLRSIDRPVNRAGMPNASGSQRFFGQRQQSGGRPSFNQDAAQIQRMVQTHNPLGAPAPAGAPTPSRTNPAASGAFGRTPQGMGQTAQPGFRGTPGQTPLAGGSPNANQRPQGRGLAQQGGVTTPGNAGRTPATAPGMTQPAQRGSPGWQRFGGGNPTAGPRQAPANGPAFNPQANRSAWGQSSTAPGTAHQAPTQMTPREPQAMAPPAPATVPRQPAPAPSGLGGNRGGWQQFGSQARPAAPANSPNQVAPSRSAPAWSARPAPQSGAAGQGGWQRFSPSPRPAPNNPSTYRQGSSGPAAQPGWGQSAPRNYGGMSAPRAPQGSTYQSAPRNYSRPPLQIRRSIVTERSAQAPRSNGGGGGGSRGGSWGGGGGGGSRGGGGGGGGRSSGGSRGGRR
jgi:hypothetical protein